MIVNVDNYVLATVSAVSFIAVWFIAKRVVAAAAISMVILAASGLVLIMKDDSVMSVFLIDASDSMAAASIPVTQEDNYDICMRFGQTDSGNGISNIQKALYDSINKIGTNGSITLYSDLLENVGDMVSAVNELKERGISLEVIVPDYSLENEVVLRDLVLPDYIAFGQNVQLEVVIESSNAAEAEVSINDIVSGDIVNKQINLEQGENRLFIPIKTDGSQLSFKVTVNSEYDTVMDNNTSEIFADVSPKMNVCVFGSEAAVADFTDAFSAFANVSGYVSGSIDNTDLYIIDDHAAINASLLNELEASVKEGSGMLVLCPENDISSWKFEKGFLNMLPAYPLRQDKKSSPDGCIVFIVDTSGSMQGARLVYAREIIRSSVKKMNTYDRVGIVEFYGNRRWALPIQYVADGSAINRSINRLTAGGGTVIYPALEEAYYGIRNTEATARHIIVITDGGIEKADYDSLLQKISNDNINVSFVMTGPAANTGFLSDMSFSGGGRFLHAADRFNLPEINIKTLSSMGADSLITGNEPIQLGQWPGMAEKYDNYVLPAEYKYFEVNRKPNSFSLIKAGEADLATCWQYGLGRVCLNTSDIFTGVGGKDLQRNIARYLARQPAQSSNVTTSSRPEVWSCSPDHELAKLIAVSTDFRSEEKYKYIDLSVWCLFLAMLCFVMQVVVRRVPVKLSVLLLVIVFGQMSWSAHAETFSEQTVEAVLNLDKDKDISFGYSLSAYAEAETESDRRFALGLAVISADTDAKAVKLEKFLQEDNSSLAINTLLKVYGMRGDFDSAISLVTSVSSNTQLDSMEKLEIERQLADIAIVARRFEYAEGYFESTGNMISLIKLKRLVGDKDQADRMCESIAASGESEYLLSLSSELVSLGYVDKALLLAQTVFDRRDSCYFDAVCSIANAYKQLHQQEQYLSFLISVADSDILNNSHLYDIAAMLEGEGGMQAAITIYSDLASKSGSIEPMMRVAALYKKKGDFLSAYNIWFQLWLCCNDKFELYQIVPNLLDLAVKNDRLADLAIKIEDEISSGEADEKGLDLLISIYLEAGDTLALLELLKMYYPDESMVSLGKQLHIYRSSGMYSRSILVLEKLIDIDPVNKHQYLEQIGVIALQSHDNQSAVKTGFELASILDDSGLEFSAGLYALVGQYDKAEKIYRHLLNQDTQNTELWLLWAEMAEKVSESSRQGVIDIMQGILKSEPEDDMFIVAVDILLNLQVAEDVLNDVYNLTMARIEAVPGKLSYYHLALDIMNEMAVSASDQAKLLLQAACFARQGRELYVSEGVNLLGRNSRLKLDLTRLLVLMNVRCSPSQYIEFGSLFMSNGDPVTAEYLYRSNSLLNSGNIDLYFIIAENYQKLSDFRSALSILQEGLSLYPDNIRFIEETAIIHEILGEFPEAYELYDRACLMGGTPEETIKSLSNEKNIDKYTQYLAMAREGVIVTSEGSYPEYINNSEVNTVMPVKIEHRGVEKKEPARISGDIKTVTRTVADMVLEELSEKAIGPEFYRELRTVINAINVEDAVILFNDYCELADITGDTLSILYIKAELANKAGYNDSARENIVKAYCIQPANRYLEMTLKKCFERDKLYAQLAAVMEDNSTAVERTFFFWRELTRIYYLAGDMDNALRTNYLAAVDGHYLLITMDRLFLYESLGDIVNLQRYFRKYQIDCRRNGKYYALKWNNWDDREQMQNRLSRTAYSVLGEHKEMLDDFICYYRVVNSDRKDKGSFEKALSYCLELNSYYSSGD